jgi:hypothetical protein
MVLLGHLLLRYGTWPVWMHGNAIGRAKCLPIETKRPLKLSYSRQNLMLECNAAESSHTFDENAVSLT